MPHAGSMYKHAALILAVLVTALRGPASAQAAPTPLQPGPNAGTADSFAGPHAWYFNAQPGHFVVELDALGLSTSSAPLDGSISVRAQFSPSAPGDRITESSIPHGILIHGTTTRAAHVFVTVMPPAGSLVRVARNYQLAATGAVAFNTNAPDPIIGGFISKMNNYGATRFSANGDVAAADGSTGHWTLFDPQLHIYTVMIGSQHLTVKLTPGVGLIDATNGSIYFESPH